MRPTRLILVPGLWQLVMAASALRQDFDSRKKEFNDVLVIYGYSLTDEIKKAMEAASRRLWNWKRVIIADGHLNRPDVLKIPAGGILDDFRELIGPYAVDEIWTCLVTNAAEKIVFETFPQSTIVLYEDGLHTYVETEEQLLNRRRPRKGIPAFLRYGFDNRFLSRLTCAYLFISQVVPPPDYLMDKTIFQVEKEYIRDAIRKLKDKVTKSDLTIQPSDCKRILLMGQGFSQVKWMDWNTEYRFYCDIINKLFAKGYSVLWKDHPKNPRPFFNNSADVRNFNGSIQVLKAETIWPVETIAGDLSVVGSLSAVSTASFNLQLIYGIPAFSFAAQAETLMNSDDHRPEFMIMTGHVADFTELRSYN